MTTPTITLPVTVKVLLNTATDPKGRPVGFFDGYTPGDALVLASTFTLDHVAGRAHNLGYVFRAFNIDEPPSYDTHTLTPEVIATYRASRHRSLSVGDVIMYGGSAFAIERVGFTNTDVPTGTIITP